MKFGQPSPKKLGTKSRTMGSRSLLLAVVLIVSAKAWTDLQKRIRLAARFYNCLHSPESAVIATTIKVIK